MQIRFPDDLPVSTRRGDIEAAIAAHPVVIVCGETGSGKTTQLPKIALAMGRAAIKTGAKADGSRFQIGHTQPRRLAASSVARRIAQELNTPLGEVVGFKVRFSDKTDKSTAVKLMTDGILLAETQSDPDLTQYDTIIIDEAHERSLNIDFLLGYLKQLLQRRSDLKVIITSATIDAERFATHFAVDGTPAPVIQVSGRSYGVEVRYRPLEDDGKSSSSNRKREENPLNIAIGEAVQELWREHHSGAGDVLVFLPGEREIREAAQYLRGQFAADARLHGSEVLTLFSRLSQAEQDRIFKPEGAPRVVLSTNIAETSLTVPRIRYVVDAGTARVKRYSFRQKVEQLHIEPVSQAAANQRAGRCGRVAEGVCIRLYDELDYQRRPEFDDPEILRSNLAGVILQMLSLKLGSVERFPFLDMPGGKAINDGWQTLHELGAVDADNRITPVGRTISRLPVDVRVARMLLAAKQHGCLEEMLVIASALSVPDPRERPQHAQEKADQAQAPFKHARSEFVSYLLLWNWLNSSRDAAPTNVGDATRNAKLNDKQKRAAEKQRKEDVPALVDAPEQRISNRQWQAKLSKAFISARRVREWRETYQQLRRAVQQQRWVKADKNEKAGLDKARKKRHTAVSYDGLHQAILTGFLGNVGLLRPEENRSQNSGGKGASRTGFKAGSRQISVYDGAHGIKFHIHPGSSLKRKQPRWIMAAEQVSTSKLFARTVAGIDPTWLEQTGEHLLSRQVGDPHFDPKYGRHGGEVLAYERATLYGLPVYHGRKVQYASIDPEHARELFIRDALMEGKIGRVQSVLDTARRGRKPKANPKANQKANQQEPHQQKTQQQYRFLQANAQLLRSIEKLEHKSRRQDVLVDDTLIYAFYDQHLPPDVVGGHSFDNWYRRAVQQNKRLLHLSKEELMRHEAAGITTDAFPHTLRLGGVDCKATYLHEPGHARDGITVELPLFALNAAQEQRCEWLVPGMLSDKVLALLKSLPQKPRARMVPLPKTAAAFAEQLAQPEQFAEGGLYDALAQLCSAHSKLEIKATQFKLDNMESHHFMALRVLGDDGRQLGLSRNLAQLKAELGGKARGAFQQLASLKDLKQLRQHVKPANQAHAGNADNAGAAVADGAVNAGTGAPTQGAGETIAAIQGDVQYTDWTFGELPEIMEIQRKVGKKTHTLVGYPALIDQGEEAAAVTLEVFDEPDMAAARHRIGLRRLFALQVKESLKYLDKNLPHLQTAGVAYMPLGTVDELKAQIINLALDRAFLQEPLPMDADSFAQRTKDGKARLNLIAQDVARLANSILMQHMAANRKIKDAKAFPDAQHDAQQQLDQLITKRFLQDTPYEQLQHLERYLKAVQQRFEKISNNPDRDAQKMAELQPHIQRYWRTLAERKGKQDTHLQQIRWVLEELRVSFFAQGLRTPYPVSLKRLDRIWHQVY